MCDLKPFRKKICKNDPNNLLKLKINYKITLINIISRYQRPCSGHWMATNFNIYRELKFRRENKFSVSLN